VNSEVKKVLFIINKFAGGGYRSDLEGRIIDTCALHNIEPIIEFTQGRHHATTLAAGAANLGVQRVVAVGGDGTLNEVAQGLLTNGIPMGIIPRGSGNGLARHLCIPLATQPALDALINGKALAMDTFTLNGKLSLNVSGIGFDGHIANLFGGKTKRGLTGYAKLTLKEFLRFPEFESTLTVGDQIFQKKAFVLAIANSSQYGNNACIAPNASVSDGILHLNVLKKIPPYRFDFVYAFFTKTIDESKYAEILEVRNFRIETSIPIPYHVDGEPCGINTLFEVIINPSALHVIVPAKALG
jgi:diacylglycerol kinase (ATP)